MKHTRSAKARQFGGAFSKFLFLVAIVGLGYSFAKNSPMGQLGGKTAAQVQADLGSPVMKEKIPRPS